METVELKKEVKEQEEQVYIKITTKESSEISAKERGEIMLPCSIFSTGLSSLEAAVKYLKEVNGLRFCEISVLLNRDCRTVWGAYNRANSKPHNFFIKETDYYIPVSIFSSRKHSMLESLTKYLKEYYLLRYCQISKIIAKDDRTVWTAYKRALKKERAQEGEYAAECATAELEDGA